MSLSWLRQVVALGWLLWAGSAAAVLNIEIIGAGDNQIPVAIAPFGGDSKLSAALNEVIMGDLQRSGLFRLVDASRETAQRPADIRHTAWVGRGAEALAVGSINQLPDGRFEARYFLVDMLKREILLGEALASKPEQVRLIGHNIADAIYQKLTGSKGVFSSHMAYVNRQGGFFRLIVADSDGYNEQVVLSGNDPIMSPAWAPDGQRLAYVSFENGHAAVYVQSLTSGKRSLVANFKGSNSAPAWSPDGQTLAVTLTRDGNSEIYLMNADGGNIRRLTFSSGIDTEPSFSPDGQSIIFTSDRGGSAQIYRMGVDGSSAQRLTFGEGANYSPRYSPDGKSFVCAHRAGGRFYIAIQDFQSGQMSLLTEGGWEKKPSFAPNGKLILFASEARGRGILATVSSDGRVKQQMFTQSGDAREPVWETRP